MVSVPRLPQRFNQRGVVSRNLLRSRLAPRMRRAKMSRESRHKVSWYRAECLLETVVATNIALTPREF